MKFHWQEVWNEQASTLDEFRSKAKMIVDHFGQRSILLLQGPLGAGKTEMVRTLVKLCCEKDVVGSPTFALHHQYMGADFLIEHWDLYRLQSQDELESSGFWDQFSADSGRVLVEWPERLNIDHLPANWDVFLLEIQLSDKLRQLYFSKRSL